jgi:hypothetical protein
LALDGVDAAELINDLAGEPRIPDIAEGLCRGRFERASSEFGQRKLPIPDGGELGGLNEQRPGKPLHGSNLWIPIIHLPGEIKEIMLVWAHSEKLTSSAQSSILITGGERN